MPGLGIPNDKSQLLPEESPAEIGDTAREHHNFRCVIHRNAGAEWHGVEMPLKCPNSGDLEGW